MKTYKTWEVIKMLSENPKLRFRDGYVEIYADDLGYLNCKDGLDDNVEIKASWQLVQEPVPFLEAMKANYYHGKTIRCERGPIVTHYKGSNICLLDMESCQSIVPSEILEGKWFIEEEE